MGTHYQHRQECLCYLLLLLLALASCRSVPQPPHPLAPLTAAEIRAAGRIFKNSGRLPASPRFSQISLAEPPKDLVLRKASVPRRAFAVIYDDLTDRTWEAVADLGRARVD